MPPSFDAVANFVRTFHGISPRRVLLPRTRIEADLGITGDDGDDLLDAAERHFGVALRMPKLFGLGPDEVLFGPEEAFDPFRFLFHRIAGEPRGVVRDLTLEQLHRAVLAAPPLASADTV
ncbi:MAG TPA: hypothetical protein VK610_00175 [Rhodothermales bacterium]|nr:hypothetical protein [Rhodothermales bacterium]